MVRVLARNAWNVMMAHALNLTLKIKQDVETLARLQELKRDFKSKLQPQIDEALRGSRIVHFARVVVVDDLYLQVITEYDGDHEAYTEFFRRALPKVFAELFSVAEGAPSFGELDQESFFRLTKGLHRPSLGEAADGVPDKDGVKEGYLFSAYGTRSVKDILGAD